MTRRARRGSARRPALGLVALALLAGVAGVASGGASASARAVTSRNPGVALACPLPSSRRAPGSSVLPATSLQLVSVAAPAGSTWATVRLWQRRRGCLQPVGGPWPARIGRSGLSGHHMEGDGTTPTGSYGIGPLMYGIGPDPGVSGRWHHLVCGDWWDEDPASSLYNRFVHLPCGQTPPFGGDSEALWTEAPAYDAFAVIEYNVEPTLPGRGSAIFLHEGFGAATTGCVALAAPQLVETLRWLRPADSPRITIAEVGGTST